MSDVRKLLQTNFKNGLGFKKGDFLRSKSGLDLETGLFVKSPVIVLFQDTTYPSKYVVGGLSCWIDSNDDYPQFLEFSINGYHWELAPEGAEQ